MRKKDEGKMAAAAVNLVVAFSGVEKGIYEQVTSFNSQNCMTEDTEIIIVGTITPTEGMKNGYFYTASRNRIYGYIDAARGTSLVKKKTDLMQESLSEKRKQIISEVKNELKEQKIAFLDVMGSAIRCKGSHADSDIKCYTLDYPVFSTVPKNVKKVICNSKLAEYCYNIIRTKILNLPVATYLSQRNGTKESWIKELKCYS